MVMYCLEIYFHGLSENPTHHVKENTVFLDRNFIHSIRLMTIKPWSLSRPTSMNLNKRPEILM